MSEPFTIDSIVFLPDESGEYVEFSGEIHPFTVIVFHDCVGPEQRVVWYWRIQAQGARLWRSGGYYIKAQRAAENALATLRQELGFVLRQIRSMESV